MNKDEQNKTSEKKKFSVKDIKMSQWVLLFLAGIILVVVSVPNLFTKEDQSQDKIQSSNTSSLINTSAKEETDNQEYISYYENKLKKLLEKMEGVGKVEVAITLQSSKERIVLKDVPYDQDSLNETDNGGGTRVSNSTKSNESTVLVTSKTGEMQPYVTKEVEALIEGVVVLAQGADDGVVKSNIVEAVVALYRVPAHKVQVFKRSD